MKRHCGFTLIELLVVIAIIGILAALILQVAGYVQKKGATSRAQAEIAALSAALESYKADTGGYPGSEGGSPSSSLHPTQDVNPGDAKYRRASGMLAVYLSGPAVSDSTNVANFKIYFEPNASILSKDTVSVEIRGADGMVSVQTRYFMDPFGAPYGYSTQGVLNGPNFPDLWSTSGNRDSSEKSTNQWIKNW